MGDSSPAKITDLNDDALAHCARYLSVRDVINMSMASKSLKRASYSDSIWTHYFRERWPNEAILGPLESLGIREAFVAKQVEYLKFKFKDPLTVELNGDEIDKGFEQILLDNDNLFLSRGSTIRSMQIRHLASGDYSYVNLNDHKARITCMRTFPLTETSFVRSESNRDDNVLLTSSSDHTIRLWWKGSCQRCFKGHNGPVTTISEKLLGDGSGKVFASGGEDGTLRLWSLSASGKRRQPSLQATLYGHEKPIKFLSVAGHKNTLVASIANDSKVRVWDAASVSSSGRSSCCVGMASVQGSAVSMKCHESWLYIAAGSSVVSIDLRTMQKANTIAVSPPKINSFAMLPSSSLFCTGGDGKAMLWDTRRNSSEAVTEMVGHKGRITQLHMDQYKIVTGGPEDVNVGVWETDTAVKANSLECCEQARLFNIKFSAMAVQGLKMVTCGDLGNICYRDFYTATLPISKPKDKSSSKFWTSQSDSDNDDSDYEEVD
ncbi:hypothetical protein AALP_AA8G154400 [Arabis alpina]|uniref:F-box domain-containing protein n=1 Tax=Arabis alpina TaxID=50452 RepID=A0A087G796_ARAAL|nr:hypothetical protein AALP_AA8G154400 [Arabis alpina]